MDLELEETLKLIFDRYHGRTQGSVFILMCDFPWFNERNGQLKKLQEEGMITELRFFDDGADITLTRKGREYLSNTKSMSIVKKPSVFISYNWGSDELANNLENALAPFADVKRDKTSIKPWGDLKDYMSSIRNQDFAVLIVSDLYLKSEACLFEVMELMKEPHWDNRVMYIVEDSASGIYKTNIQIKYIEYWSNKEQQLVEKLKKLNPDLVTNQAEELRKIKQISMGIGEFLTKVKQTNNPDIEKSIQAIKERVSKTRNLKSHDSSIINNNRETVPIKTINCKKLNNILSLHLSNDNLKDCIASLNGMVELLCTIPQTTRSFLKTMILRAYEKSGSEAYVVPVDEVMNALNIDLQACSVHIDSLKRRGFATDIDYNPDNMCRECFLKGHDGWNYWVMVRMFCEKSNIDLNRICIDLDLSIFDE